MRKALLIIIICLSFTSLIFASPENIPDPNISQAMRQMTVGGTYRGTISVDVIPIVSDVSSIEGAPFDMLGDDVVADYGYVGRKIAEWTLASNYNNVNMTITPHPLKGPERQDESPSSVNYVLYFYYDFPTFDNVDGEEDGYQSGSFYVISSESYTKQIIPDSGKRTVLPSGSIINISTDKVQKIMINGGEIRVFFPTGEMETIRDNYQTPPGTYTATVEINVESN